MIKEVKNKKDLKKFIHFIETLYQNDSHYVFPIFYALTRELNKEVLEDQKYKAILSLSNDQIQGRLMYTFQFDSKRQMNVCFFSFFDAINDVDVVKELFDAMEVDMRANKVWYAEGTFAPYDPDTKRGILVQGFDDDPTFLTSYNAEYYAKLMDSCGFIKAYDTYSMKAEVSPESERVLNTLTTHFINHYHVRIDQLDMKHLDRDIQDVHTILEAATTELNYQEAPSIEMIHRVAKNMKMFINPSLIRIAREEASGEPVGFCLVIPDFNQVLKITKGRIKPLVFIRQFKRITRARGMLQYIVPKYQSTGLIGYMYQIVFSKFEHLGITDFEGGTMMEDNVKPLKLFAKFGGRVVKTYRIYGKELPHDL